MKLKLPPNDDTFSYYSPHTKLAQYIAYYSFTKPHAALSSISPIFIPDLGGSLIINHYEDDLNLIIWGPSDEPAKIKESRRQVVAQCFIEFHPSGLSRFVCPNSKELLNQQIAFAEVGCPTYTALKRVFEQDDLEPSKLVLLLDEYFLGLLEKKDCFENGRHILSVLQGLKQGATMSDLSKETHYSTRHINRYLNALTGVSGKKYMRIKRVSKAAQVLKESACSIEHVATQLEYYDAAHFVRDFVEIVGTTPGLYQKNVSGYYNESSKLL